MLMEPTFFFSPIFFYAIRFTWQRLLNKQNVTMVSLNDYVLSVTRLNNKHNNKRNGVIYEGCCQGKIVCFPFTKRKQMYSLSTSWVLI